MRHSSVWPLRLRIGAARAAALFALPALAGALACSGDGPTEPSRPFDAQSSADAVEPMRQTVDGDSDVLIGLELIGASLDQQGLTAAVIPDDPAHPARSISARAAAQFALQGVSTSESAVPVFPEELLGTTFTWDPSADEYAVDPSRVDAPANGVRFVLYASEPITRRPVEPLVEVGFIDLVDEGSLSTTRLAVIAVVGAETLVDYVIEASFLTDGQSLTGILEAEGFLSDGVHRLDFEIRESATVTDGSETIEIHLLEEVAEATAGVSARLALDGVVGLLDGGAGTALEFELAIDDGSGVLVIAGSLTSETVEGTITWGSARVASFSGPADNPTYTKEDGSALTQADREALEKLSDFVEDLSDFSDDLFNPFTGA